MKLQYPCPESEGWEARIMQKLLIGGEFSWPHCLVHVPFKTINAPLVRWIQVQEGYLQVLSFLLCMEGTD